MSDPPTEQPPRDASSSISEEPELRRSDRTRCPPQRFSFDIN